MEDYALHKAAQYASMVELPTCGDGLLRVPPAANRMTVLQAASVVLLAEAEGKEVLAAEVRGTCEHVGMARKVDVK